MPTMTHPGISERRDSDGRIRYRVRVRRGGVTFTATLDSLAAALSWRSRALDAADGLADAPESPRRAPAVSAAPSRAVTVHDTARRLVRGMRDGSIRTKRGERYKPSAVRDYEAALRLDVLPRIGGIGVASLRRGDIQQLADEIAADTSASRARRALVALRVALNVAARYGDVDDGANPCAGVKVPVDDDPPRPARIPTAAECERLLDAAERDDVGHGRSLAAPLVALALGTGLRLGELLALPWGNEGLDLDAGLVHVRRALDRHLDRDGRYPFVRPKSRAARRSVPLALDDASGLRRHRLATGRPADGELVFPGDNGQPLAPHGVPRSAWKRAANDAGIAEPLPRFHDLRHAYATHQLAAGLTAHAVAELLGHADAGLVWQRYGHALPDEVARAGETLAAWRASQQP